MTQLFSFADGIELGVVLQKMQGTEKFLVAEFDIAEHIYGDVSCRLDDEMEEQEKRVRELTKFWKRKITCAQDITDFVEHVKKMVDVIFEECECLKTFFFEGYSIEEQDLVGIDGDLEVCVVVRFNWGS